MSTEIHDCDVWLDSDISGAYWSPSCSCGWDGRYQKTHSAAIEAWENHCETVFSEATERAVR